MHSQEGGEVSADPIPSIAGKWLRSHGGRVAHCIERVERSRNWSSGGRFGAGSYRVTDTAWMLCGRRVDVSEVRGEAQGKCVACVRKEAEIQAASDELQRRKDQAERELTQWIEENVV